MPLHFSVQWLRSKAQRFFLQFGLHCATHQIRVILISCIVITSLFYPALSIYSSSQPKFLSVIKDFASPTAGSHLDGDVENIWFPHKVIRVYDDAVTRAKCSRALRVERILIQSSLDGEDGVLSHHTLLSTLKLEQRLESMMAAQHIPCLKHANEDNCFAVSPLAFWDHNLHTLNFDNNIRDTLIFSKNVTLSGVPFTWQMVLAGRGSYDHHVTGFDFDYADYLALTYFFPESECLGNSEHDHWTETVRHVVAQDTEATFPEQEPTLIALQFNPNLSQREGWSALSTFLYLAYVGFFIYVIWSFRRMDAVHSRLGVTFTALVEIAVSTITSLSVCALVGFKVTMVPWELLPIVIVFVGAENMFNLVDAVGRTSVTLSVKQRIAEGLSRAGTSNTLKVVTYNTILGIISVFAAGAVRQFCVFAIVVLVAHWFLAHTFFIAVLSIDIARLELEELLRRDTSLAPAVPTPRKDAGKQEQRQGWRKLIVKTQTLLKGRATTNISLLMLLAIAATLYYTTYTTQSVAPDAHRVLRSGKALRPKSRLSEHVNERSPARLIWDTLNPSQVPLLHVRIESPIIITLDPTVDTLNRVREAKVPRTRLSKLTFHVMVWLLKIMVLPIAATTSALYGLLLYLLKNTELLEAQRNRAGPDSLQLDDVNSLEDRVLFSTVPRAFTNDVELISTSKGGEVVVAVGLNNEVVVWRTEKRINTIIDATDLLRAASTSSSSSLITSLAVSPNGTHFAVGTGASVVAIWAIGANEIHSLPVMALENSSAAVMEMHFVSPINQKPDLSSDPASPVALGSATTVALLATYENGMAARWTVGELPAVEVFAPSQGAAARRSSLLYAMPDEHVLLAFSLEDGAVELVETGDYEPTILEDCVIYAGSVQDHVWKVHACRTVLNGSMRFVVVAATESGRVSLWDGLTGECIWRLDEPAGTISKLRVAPVYPEVCQLCGELPQESLYVAFSVGPVVRFHKLLLNDQTRCAHHHRRHVPKQDIPGRQSRSNSSFSQTGPPLTLQTRLSMTFETSAFPVSPHGVHSRRISEKDTGRRSSEVVLVPFQIDDYEPTRLFDGTTTPTPAPSSSIWRSATVIRMTDISCERGAWDLSDQRFVGLRRTPRSQSKARGDGALVRVSTPAEGLSFATLERWEFWLFDPAAAALRTSLLSSLSQKPPETYVRMTGDVVTRLPFTRAPVFIISSPRIYAGFGNTIGILHLLDS